MIPDGLERCATCGELKGEFLYDDGWVAALTPVICICDGIACTSCGRNRIRRPTSNHYDERDGRVWHTPYSLTICSECIAARRWSPVVTEESPSRGNVLFAANPRCDSGAALMSRFAVAMKVRLVS